MHGHGAELQDRTSTENGATPPLELIDEEEKTKKNRLDQSIRVDQLGTKNRYRFLFVMEMAEGLVTMYENLRTAVERMDNVDATWLPIQLNPAEQVAGAPLGTFTFLARIPPFSTSWSLQRGLLTRYYVRSLERSGRSFDAAYFNSAPLAFFLRRFRRRVPCVDALDATPTILARYGYNKPRADGNVFVRSLRHRLARNVFKDATHLLPWSKFAKESLVADYGIPEEKISIVPPGIDLKTWFHDSGGSPEARASIKKTAVLFVGGNFARKGGDLLLKVARRDEFRQCDFHFVTQSFAGPPTNNVFVHAGLKANSDQLMALYREADVFVLPTRADLTPQAICEAMAMELPVISTSVGGIDDMIADGETGFTVPVDDEDACSDRLRALIGNAELRTRLGSNGRQLAESKFNLETNAKTIVECLKKAADTRRDRK